MGGGEEVKMIQGVGLVILGPWAKAQDGTSESLPPSPLRLSKKRTCDVGDNPFLQEPDTQAPNRQVQVTAE